MKEAKFFFGWKHYKNLAVLHVVFRVLIKDFLWFLTEIQDLLDFFWLISDIPG